MWWQCRFSRRDQPCGMLPRELVLKVAQAIQQSADALQYASSALRSDPTPVANAVKQFSHVYLLARGAARADKDLAVEALRCNGHLLQHISGPLRSSKEVVLADVSSEGAALQHAPRHLRADREVVLTSVRSDCRALEYAAAELKAGSDREIMMEAVARDGDMLMYASGTLRNLTGALSSDTFCPSVVSRGISGTESFCFCALASTLEPSRSFMKFLILLLWPLLASGLRRKPQGRSGVFVHLFEWSWPDVARECEDWLGPKGFSAVQVSPPTEHIQGHEWWTRYQPVTYNLSSRSGDEKEFASMVKRCKKANVQVYVDAVLNHCAANKGTSISGNIYGGRKTPIFSPEDFHHIPGDTSGNCGVSNFADIHNVQFCDLQGLPDLCTECEGVQSKIAAYLSQLVELGVAGVRLDAAKHIPKADLAKIFDKVKDGNKLLKYAEVSKATTTDVVTEELYVDLVDVIEFNYYPQLDQGIAESGRMSNLESLGGAPDLVPGSSAVVFVDNHDTQRSKDRAPFVPYTCAHAELPLTCMM
eukprot:s377_g18.t1